MDMRRRTTLALTAALAGLLGSYLYAGILNPLNVEWLLTEGDLLQHYLGWHFFRHEGWSWPLGALHTYGTQVRSSIVFTDSLPLVALPLKLVNAWLPDPFQYQGLAALGHLVLNATAAALILHRLKLPTVAVVALSLVVAFLPAVVFRGPGGAGHESLMAHWVLLLALYLLLFATHSGWRARGQWAALLAVAVLVHFYLFLLAGICWGLWWLHRTLEHARIQSAQRPRHWWWGWAAYTLLTPLAILGIMWAVGYLHSSGESPGADGFGFYSAELLAYINGYSFLRGIDSASAWWPGWEASIEGQYEGMSYVGLGVLLLWAIALWLMATRPVWPSARQRWPLYSIAALGVGLFIFALSDTMVVGPYALHVPLPWPDALRALLRASGRMVWVLMYLSIMAAAFVLTRRLKPGGVTLAALAVLVVQAADLHRWHGYFHAYSQQAASYQMAEDPRLANWQQPALRQALHQRRALHITHADDIVGMLPLAWLAGQYHMEINVAYVARISLPIIHRATTPDIQALEAGQPDPLVVYAITSPDTAQRVCQGEARLRCIETPLATFAWQPFYEERP